MSLELVRMYQKKELASSDYKFVANVSKKGLDYKISPKTLKGSKKHLGQSFRRFKFYRIKWTICTDVIKCV